MNFHHKEDTFVPRETMAFVCPECSEEVKLAFRRDVVQRRVDVHCSKGHWWGAEV